MYPIHLDYFRTKLKKEKREVGEFKTRFTLEEIVPDS